MADLHDWNWSIEERAEKQYKHFVLLGMKGMAFAYPTITLSDPEAHYSAEEARMNATVASHAPNMLRALERLANHMRYSAEDDPLIRGWRDEVLTEIAIAKGEVEIT
jgi:hypothetical protein